MNVKQAILCCLLIGSASLSVSEEEIVCATITMNIPFCKDWICKPECWLQKKLRKIDLMESQCIKGGINGKCQCIACKDVDIPS
ncbi:unnamed protein product [Urochloa decumbens]|uniref:Uncharacterized protein n=1 Tax=Urochloa decumbens TaxID=240449 RepID=A0ABC9CDI3_9POAL